MARIEPLPLAPTTIIEGALAELEHLTRLINGLSPGDWWRLSAVEGWTVGQVVAHLDLFLSIYNRLLNPVLAGDGIGGMGTTISWLTESVMPTIGPIFDTVNGTLPRVMDRGLAPDVVTRQCAASVRRTRDLLLSVGRDDDTRPVDDVTGSSPRSFYVAIIVHELAIHGWDLESAIANTAELSENARRILPRVLLEQHQAHAPYTEREHARRPGISLRAGILHVVVDLPRVYAGRPGDHI